MKKHVSIVGKWIHKYNPEQLTPKLTVMSENNSYRKSSG